MEQDAPRATPPSPLGQPVLDYRDPAGQNRDLADRRRVNVALASAVPGCLIVAAALVALFTYAMIFLASLNS